MKRAGRNETLIQTARRKQGELVVGEFRVLSRVILPHNIEEVVHVPFTMRALLVVYALPGSR